jgi:hypothetical protein
MYLGLVVLLLGASLHPAASGPKKRTRAASEEHPSAEVMAIEEEFVEEETAEPVTTKRHLAAAASTISLDQAMLEHLVEMTHAGTT